MEAIRKVESSLGPAVLAKKFRRRTSFSSSRALKSWPLILSKIWRVGSLYFHSGSKRAPRLLLALVLLLCGLCAGMLVLFSYVQRDFSTAISSKDLGGLHKTTWRSILMVIIATPLFAFYEYMQGLLALEWRIWLTDLLLADYFANRAYFDLKMEGKLDNPDQRICEDIAGFVDNAVGIITLTCGKLLKIAGFTGVLWSISPRLVYFLFIYSAVGTYLTVRFFGEKIMHLKFQGLQMQADFRYSVVRIRDNAESIAFYRGEKHELTSIKGFFMLIVANTRELLNWSRHLSFFSNAYEFSVMIIPSLIIAPRYFAGEVEFGVVSQTGFAFRHILTALSMIILKFDRFSGFAAQTERLDGLLQALLSHQGSLIHSGHKQGQSIDVEVEISYGSATSSLLNIDTRDGSIERGLSKGLIIKGLNVVTPNLRNQLINNLDVSLAMGKSLLVMGPSGCGKSSLLRTIAGLWNHGAGLIQGPPHSETFFLPQKPYVPLGNLEDQLLFPSSEVKSGKVDEDRLLQQLAEVALEDLPNRVGGLYAVCDWADVLSLGEQQRLAFARLLLHEPSMAFLDEATSALDALNEERLYSVLEKQIPSYVSVGHRSSLVKFHTNVLVLGEADGKWSIYSREEFQNVLAGRLPSIVQSLGAC